MVVLCVPDAPQVEEALFGPRGVEAGAARGLLVIDMSTISPVATRRFAQRLAEREVEFVDAPVSGGPVRAADGTLTIMVGASRAAFERAKPVLRAMGVPHHLGPVGMGETVKLVNQIIIANVMIANVEGLVFAREAGADLGEVCAVLASATASNYVLEKWLPENLAGGHVRGRFCAGSAAQRRRGCTRCGSGRKPSHAGHRAGLPTLYQPLRKGRWRAGLQRDRKSL